MTIQEMHIAFKVELDRSDSLSYPDFLPEEIDYWLNKAILSFVEQAYNPATADLKAFELSQADNDNLRTIKEDAVLSPTTYSASTNTFGFSLPSNYFLAVREEAEIIYWDCHSTATGLPFTLDIEGSRATIVPLSGSVKKICPITQTTENRFNTDKQNPYSMHRLKDEEAWPLRRFHKNLTLLTTDGTYGISTYYLTYLRKPVSVNFFTSVNSDLPERIHQTIVASGVLLAIESIGATNRYQTKSIDNLKNNV